jgi:hypothetical protein
VCTNKPRLKTACTWGIVVVMDGGVVGRLGCVGGWVWMVDWVGWVWVWVCGVVVSGGVVDWFGG